MEEIKFDNEYLNRLFREKFKKQSFTLEDIKSAEIILIDFSFAKDKRISQKDLDILTKNSFIILENINCSNLTFNLMRGAKIYLKSCNLNGCILQESNDDKEYDVNYYADFLGISNNVFSDFLNIEKSSKISRMLDIHIEESKVSSSFFETLKSLTCDITLELEKYNISLDDINFLKSIKNIKSLSFCNCIIEKECFKILTEMKNIKKFDFSRSNVTIDEYEIIKSLSLQVEERVSFNDTQLAEELKKRIIDFNGNEEVENKIRKLVWKERKNESNLFFVDEPVNEYDILSSGKSFSHYVEGMDFINFLIENEYIDYLFNPDNLILEINNLENISPKTLEYVNKNLKNIKILLKDLGGVTKEVIEKLDENVNIEIENDLFSYNKDTIIEVLEVLEEIKKSIPQNASEEEKFFQCLKILSYISDYDRSGCISNENYSKENCNITRSVYGALILGRSVCSGYAVAFKNIAQYIGIEVKIVHGIGNTGSEQGGHAWNQVKIDGKWYNLDVTWIYKEIRMGEKLEYCLVSDEEFYKDHIVDEYKPDEVECCLESYSEERCKVFLDSIEMEVENDSKQLGRGYKCLITGEELHEISKSIITSNSSSSSAKKDSALNELENSEKEKDTLSEIKIQDQDERDDER